MNKVILMTFLFGLFSCSSNKNSKKTVSEKETLEETTTIKAGGPSEYKEYKLTAKVLEKNENDITFSLTYFDGDKQLNRLNPVIIYFAPDTIKLERNDDKFVFDINKTYNGSVELMVKGSIPPQSKYYSTFKIENNYFKILDFKRKK